MENQQDNYIPFLDVIIAHQPNGSLSHQVFLKKEHIDRYLYAQFHHHPTKNCVVIKTLVSKTIWISTPQYINKEKTHLTKSLQVNVYSQIDRESHSILYAKTKTKNPLSTSPP